MQTLDDFIKENNGKYVEVSDSSNYAQCMDLAYKWCDNLNIPRDTIRHLYAYQVWTNPLDITHKYFDLIPNGPSNVPKEGSLTVFGQRVGYAGHISIATNKSNGIDLVSFDQNWGNPKYCREVTHYKYYGVLGWLTPKPQEETLDQFKNRLRTILNRPDIGDGEKMAQIRKMV